MKKAFSLFLLMVVSFSLYASEREIVFEQPSAPVIQQGVEVVVEHPAEAIIDQSADVILEKANAVAPEQVEDVVVEEVQIKDDAYYEALYDALSPENKRNFIDNSILIQTTIESGSKTSYSNILSSSLASASTQTITRTNWQAFKGPIQISRLDFYRTVDALDLEVKQLEYERKLRNFNLGCLIPGGILSIGGLAVLAAGLGVLIKESSTSIDDSSDLPYKLEVIGASLICAGLIPILVWEFAAPEEPEVGINFVFSLANEYNRKLLETYR